MITKNITEKDAEAFLSAALATPFSDETFDFIEALRQKLSLISRSKQSENDGELSALIFWLRSSNMKAMQNFCLPADIIVPRPLGTIFSVAPSNVTTLFVYVSVIALLMGNRIAVRISRKHDLLVDEILAKVSELFVQQKFTSMMQRWLVFTGEHDDIILHTLSQSCRLRVLWGGDNAIDSLRKIRLSPQAHELVFPDRVSAAYIHPTSALLDDMRQLALLFTGELKALGQMGCNSPKIVVWQNNSLTSTFRETFWHSVCGVLESAGNPFSPVEQGICTQSLLTSLEDAKLEYESPVVVISTGLAPDLISTVRTFHTGHGVCIELFVDSLDELSILQTERLQTLGIAGIPIDTSLKEMFAKIDGVERIVAVGASTHFDVIWDGINLVQAFSRTWR